MNAETSVTALRYLLQDDIYLLDADKALYRNPPQLPVEPIAKETPDAVFKYLGSNKKNFLIISYYPGESFMPEPHLKALESTLNRISFTLDDVAIINKAHYPGAGLNELASFFTPAKLLILGKNAMPTGVPAMELNLAQTINSCLTLYTFGFDEMMGHKESTKAFWNQIKTF